jgi:hypothetical protein
LTPELAERFATALAVCWHLSVAADFVGIPRRTAHHWIRRGRREKRGIYRRLLLTLREKLAQREALCLAAILEAGKTNWTANAWILERRWPTRWSSSVKDIQEIKKWIAQQEQRQKHDTQAHPAAQAASGNGPCPRPLA